ncbi:MAG: hypothetical protein ACRDU7_06450 [Acidimicrobiia bacterium]
MPELLAIEATLLTATFLVPQIVRIISREDRQASRRLGRIRGGHQPGVGCICPGPGSLGRLLRPGYGGRGIHDHTGPHRAPCAGIEWWRPSFWSSASLLAAEALMGPAGLGLLPPRRSCGAAMGWLVADLLSSGYGVVTVIGSALILARCWATRPGVRLVRALVEV